MKRIAGLLAFVIAAAGCSSPAKETVIAESQDKHVQLLADTKVSGDMLSGVTVKIGENSKHFSWSNVTNDSYYPQIIREDLDQDAEPEIVIILTQGYGTGVLDSEVHVLEEDFTEFEVQDPIAVVKEELKSTVSSKDGKKTYTLTYKDNTITKEYKDEDAGMWFDEAAIGNIVTYRVDNQHLIAEVSAQASPGLFVANVEAAFEAKNNKLEVSNLAIKEFE
ncbi:hypothetical protein PCCS19_05270 [Paenibacillus sp. CCS19]|uniref:hypothetical protein n=1 Tax=Paenibacillus sp. CCS19 TaxID=3158387 RepID=UPI00256E4730|nr:hypothetical protein [Paenibacillus cellulosilyticus]GMK37473.1 hypothetical protein PCCS19_05270 [Paenibacillus cellulosilyticus]